jgi:phosphate transport system substrate-binding protein
MRAALVLAVGAALLTAAPANAARTPTITVSGAFAATAVTADLAYFYRRAVRSPPRFDLVGGRTVTGIADVARGISDIGLATRPLGPDDPAGLVFTPYARTGICLVTNRANPVPGLSRAQIQDLVAARLTSWPQVPGSPLQEPIVAGALTVGGGSRTAFEATLLDAETPQLYAPRVWITSAQMRDFIKVTPNAWGYVDLAFTAELHVVAYEGIPCTRATVSSGAYPARTEFGFVTRGRPKGRVARFIRWVRTSRKARRVIATRYVPVQRATATRGFAS